VSISSIYRYPYSTRSIHISIHIVIYTIMPTLQKQKSPAAAKAKKKAAKSKSAAKGGKEGTKNNEKVINIKEEEINLTCTHCNKTFTTEAGLLYHMGKFVFFFHVWMGVIDVFMTVHTLIYTKLFFSIQYTLYTSILLIQQKRRYVKRLKMIKNFHVHIAIRYLLPKNDYQIILVSAFFFFLVYPTFMLTFMFLIHAIAIYLIPRYCNIQKRKCANESPREK